MAGRYRARASGNLKRIDCVSVLITRGSPDAEEVLLVWNSDWRQPCWSFPGGAREPNESLEEAAKRETREETGLEIELGGMADLHEIIGLGGRIHLVIFTFLGTVVGGSLLEDGSGEPRPGEVSRAQWFPLSDARRIDFVGGILNRHPQLEPAACTYGYRREEAQQPGRRWKRRAANPS